MTPSMHLALSSSARALVSLPDSARQGADAVKRAGNKPRHRPKTPRRGRAQEMEARHVGFQAGLQARIAVDAIKATGQLGREKAIFGDVNSIAGRAEQVIALKIRAVVERDGQ